MDLKETQHELFELMVALDTLCREHNILYTLHGGTLLGAVREKGFIPWDDDMDIVMTRQEYEKLEVALSENADFHIVGNIKKQFRRKDNHLYWVDIFICDYIDQRPRQQKLKQLALTTLDVMNRDKNTIALSDFSKYGFGKRFAFKTAYLCGKLLTKGFKSKLYHKVSRTMWTGNHTVYVRSNDHLKGRQMVFPAQWLDGYERIPFSTAELSVSSHYHKLLVSFFGEDYMTPLRDDRNSAVHDIVRGKKDITL